MGEQSFHTPEDELHIPEVSPEGVRNVFDQAVRMLHSANTMKPYREESHYEFLVRQHYMQYTSGNLASVLDSVLPLEGNSWNKMVRDAALREQS